MNPLSTLNIGHQPYVFYNKGSYSKTVYRVVRQYDLQWLPHVEQSFCDACLCGDIPPLTNSQCLVEETVVKRETNVSVITI